MTNNNTWSKIMSTVNLCGHTNAQHMYHDSGDLKLEPCSRTEPTPSCTVCGTPMKSVYKCPKCGSTPACSEPAPELTPEQFYKEWKRTQYDSIATTNDIIPFAKAYAAALQAERDRLIKVGLEKQSRAIQAEKRAEQAERERDHFAKQNLEWGKCAEEWKQKYEALKK